jgi:DNA-directed RNA polymerase subunit RPC12/RpoP
MTSFDKAWKIMKSDEDIDGDENDDEFIDNDLFSNREDLLIEALLGIADPNMTNLTDMCYSCGFEGTRANFMYRHPSGRRENRCPECGSFSIHGKDAYSQVPDRSNETYEEELARRNAYYRKIEEELRRKKTGVDSGNE